VRVGLVLLAEGGGELGGGSGVGVGGCSGSAFSEAKESVGVVGFLVERIGEVVNGSKGGVAGGRFGYELCAAIEEGLDLFGSHDRREREVKTLARR
jgi:hypothetical protein